MRNVGEEAQFQIREVLLDARLAADPHDGPRDAPGDDDHRQRRQHVERLGPPRQPGRRQHVDLDGNPLVGGIGIPGEGAHMETVAADRQIGVGRPVRRPRDDPVLVVTFEFVHVSDDMLNGIVQRCELHAQVREVVGKDDAPGLGHRLRERRAAFARDDGFVAHVEAREAQVVVDLRRAHLLRIEAVEPASAAEEDIPLRRGQRRCLAEYGVAHVVVEVVVREELATRVEARDGVVGRDPEVALPVFGHGHADVADQPARRIVAPEAGQALAVIPLDAVQSAAEGRQPHALLPVFEHVDDVVVAQRRGVARDLLHEAEAHLTRRDPGIEDQQTVDRGRQHAVRTIVEQPPHPSRLVQRVVRHLVAGVDEALPGRIFQQVDAPAVGCHPDAAVVVLLDAIDLIVAQRPGIRVGVREVRDAVACARGGHAVEPLAFGSHPDVARRVLAQGVDHARSARGLTG